ncbi:MAG: hypothetical protein AAFN50_15435 [Pseudomonadota bacterium]
MKTICLLSILLGLPLAVQPANAQNELELLTLDEQVWVAFYDVPSRRFRTVRDKFVVRDFESAARDLDTSIAFLKVEAGRAADELQPDLNDVIKKLQTIRDSIATAEVTSSTLDLTFARTHWLLAQHFFVLALNSRESGAHKNAGHYLWATAHHVERAVLWSNARIDRKTVNSLESLRSLANRLKSSSSPDRVYQDRPIRLAARTIISVGEHLDRSVRIAELLSDETNR